MTSATISPFLILIPPPSKSPSFYLSKSRSQPPSFLPSIQLRRNHAATFQKTPRLWRISAAAESSLPSEAAAETAQQVVSAAGEDGGVSTIISALLFVAFIGLSLLTIGIIYLAIQDFLQKREKDKFEKEEGAKKKKGGKKTKVTAKTGPRGFGQKIEEEDE